MLQGKLIEIHFSETGKISGAKIQTCKILELPISLMALDILIPFVNFVTDPGF